MKWEPHAKVRQSFEYVPGFYQVVSQADLSKALGNDLELTNATQAGKWSKSLSSVIMKTLFLEASFEFLDAMLVSNYSDQINEGIFTKYTDSLIVH